MAEAVRDEIRGPDTALTLDEGRGRWVLFAAVLGSGLALLDATVVNIALPPIGADLGADFSGLQWTVNAYTLTLASLILLGGSLGDRFGRRRVFVLGTIWFTLASLLCGIAPNIETLVAARLLQGVGGALLTPGSLALTQASFRPEERARAIGAWSGLGGGRRLSRPCGIRRRVPGGDADLRWAARPRRSAGSLARFDSGDDQPPAGSPDSRWHAESQSRETVHVSSRGHRWNGSLAYCD